jgi:solute carrier family 6 amino acid transporter-like protein 5/7/9/14
MNFQAHINFLFFIAFISYPDAIAKFEYLPQLFSVLFFLMLFVLGMGSVVAMISCAMTVIRDKFPKIKNWHAALLVSTVGFCIGLVYVTPGGMLVLDLIDSFGATYPVFVFAIAELVAICWIYGVRRLCKDMQFMLGSTPSLYWRICWNYIV